MRVWQRTISVDDKGKVTYGKAKSRTLTMKEAEELKAIYADRVQWDDDLKLHYLRFGNDELGEQLLAYAETGKEPRIAGGLRNKSATISEVWFEDEASMAYKRELMSELKLAGFAAWRKGFETSSFRQFMYNDAVPAKNVPHGTAKRLLNCLALMATNRLRLSRMPVLILLLAVVKRPVQYQPVLLQRA